MITYETLNRYTIKRLKQEISKENIKKYSHMTKDSIIKLMLKNSDKFEHLKINKEQDNLLKSINEKNKKLRKAKNEIKKLMKKK